MITSETSTFPTLILPGIYTEGQDLALLRENIPRHRPDAKVSALTASAEASCELPLLHYKPGRANNGKQPISINTGSKQTRWKHGTLKRVFQLSSWQQKSRIESVGINSR